MDMDMDMDMDADASNHPGTEVLQLVTGPLQENCFLLWGAKKGEAVVFDPGDEADRIQAALDERHLKPAAFVQTHCHGDHIGALNDLKANHPTVPLYVPTDEKDWLSSPLHNLSYFTGAPVTGPEPDILVSEGDVISVAGFSLRAIHIPGHSPGGTAYFIETPKSDPPHLFAGDILFQGSIGRTDFPGCAGAPALIGGIREKLFVLPEETLVHTGHGPDTSIGLEKDTNPFCGENASMYA